MPLFGRKKAFLGPAQTSAPNLERGVEPASQLKVRAEGRSPLTEGREHPHPPPPLQIMFSIDAHLPNIFAIVCVSSRASVHAPGLSEITRLFPAEAP